MQATNVVSKTALGFLCRRIDWVEACSELSMVVLTPGSIMFLVWKASIPFSSPAKDLCGVTHTEYLIREKAVHVSFRLFFFWSQVCSGSLVSAFWAKPCSSVHMASVKASDLTVWLGSFMYILWRHLLRESFSPKPFKALHFCRIWRVSIQCCDACQDNFTTRTLWGRK